MIHPSVAIVILNWNGKHFLEKFLPLVIESSYPNKTIYVADNGSIDDSVWLITTKFPEVKIIALEGNYGFTGGYNRALAQIEADYFVLLNSDVEVEKHWIEPVIKLMESDPVIAVAQPKIKDFTNKDFFEYAGAAGGFIDYLGYPFCRGRIFDTLEKDEGQYDDSREIFWASGAAFFIKSTYWKLIGGFDENFFAHMEEIDLCWRLKNLGYTIFYCAESTVYHVGGGALNKENPRKTFLNFRNNLVLLHKNLPKNKGFKIILIRMFLDGIAVLKFLFSKGIKHALMIDWAHVQYLWNIKKWNKSRKNNPTKTTNLIYKKSIVWQYYVKKIKLFSGLGIDNQK